MRKEGQETSSTLTSSSSSPITAPCIIARRILKTTTERQVIEQPNVKAFLARKARNSKGTARTYGLGLASMQEFLNINKYGIELNDINPSFFTENEKKTTVYELIDNFISYLHTTRGLSRSTIHLYVEAVKGYFGDRDIEIKQNGHT
jgi:hypothetical protein